MARKIQTTYTFNTQDAAQVFRTWLKRNENDRDYGYPKFLYIREVGGWLVEYQCETDFARGVATGIETAAMALVG